MNISSSARGLSAKAKALTVAALIGGLMAGGVALGGAANAASGSESNNTASATDNVPISVTPIDYYWGDQKIDSIAISQNPDGTYTTAVYVNGEWAGSFIGPQPQDFPTTPRTAEQIGPVTP
jgi:hypothetical protein